MIQTNEYAFETAIEHHLTTASGYEKGDRETARIDTLIGKVRKSINLLREYRTALISAAVTGEIDVREEVA